MVSYPDDERYAHEDEDRGGDLLHGADRLDALHDDAHLRQHRHASTHSNDASGHSSELTQNNIVDTVGHDVDGPHCGRTKTNPRRVHRFLALIRMRPFG